MNNKKAFTLYEKYEDKITGDAFTSLMSFVEDITIEDWLATCKSNRAVYKSRGMDCTEVDASIKEMERVLSTVVETF
jgi:hypothetical protein